MGIFPDMFILRVLKKVNISDLSLGGFCLLVFAQQEDSVSLPG